MSSMVTLIANAAPVPYALKQEIVAKLGDGFLYEVYGSTELGVDTVLKPEDQLRKPGSCGKPYGGIEIRIVTDDGTDRRAERAGRAVRAHDARDGRLPPHRPAAHRARRGRVEVGRRRRVRRRRGLRLHLRPQEGHDHLGRRQHLSRPRSKPCSTRIRRCSTPRCSASPTTSGASACTRSCRPSRARRSTSTSCAAFVEPRLAAYKRPRGYELRDELPRTDSGKLLKRVLRDEYWTGPQQLSV